MLEYDKTALTEEAALLMEWYWPLKLGTPASTDLIAEYTEITGDLCNQCSAPHAIVLRDFHAENLLWLPERDDIARAGIIDFQDALYGHGAYDVVSLLEDARRDVDPEFALQMIDYFIDARGQKSPFDEDGFRTDYAILAAQRNAKILGVFARLAVRDGKKRYLDLLPRVEDHFRRDLARPTLKPLKTFMAQHFPDLTL